ncbi:hypothetical protein Desdi_0477 [Desulfitobacterium dichloroeliminans LMG P-21439]|uniref:DUF5317 domain-containing protein n=1 Tax=Desulfitobacterium dichloroeliminans (strain LMG P-21439 / DCA1) TaxID=871963 RepID=L0F4T1_DESDL|nr:DUF5317 domain-containing protein [Desulfitobacterium dichloroeliminans]AGA68020.1 hypothetical protein Desdi_0477 [Desulfitobacterium dichloroeliminans LMG P-21439]
MLLESMILAVLIGFLSGGSFNSLVNIEVKRLELLFLGALLQIFAFWSVKFNLGWSSHWVIPLTHSLSYFFLMSFTWMNRSFQGFSLVTLGIALNAAVISFNGGLMPVDPTLLPEASRQLLLVGTGTHGILTETTQLSFLADIFYANIPIFGKQLFSLGDVLIDLGMVVFIVKQMRRPTACNAVKEGDAHVKSEVFKP